MKFGGKQQLLLCAMVIVITVGCSSERPRSGGEGTTTTLMALQANLFAVPEFVPTDYKVTALSSSATTRILLTRTSAAGLASIQIDARPLDSATTSQVPSSPAIQQLAFRSYSTVWMTENLIVSASSSNLDRETFVRVVESITVVGKDSFLKFLSKHNAKNLTAVTQPTGHY